jgi:hypothetical protein
LANCAIAIPREARGNPRGGHDRTERDVTSSPDSKPSLQLGNAITIEPK